MTSNRTATLFGICLAAFLLLSSPATAGVDQQKVDAAIEKGIKFLFSSGPNDEKHQDYNQNQHTMRNDELVLLTYIHAGVSPDDPKLTAILDKILEAPLEKTYMVSIQAMALQELDSEKYQWRIAQCGQYLVDNQCKNGQWGYGEPLGDDIPTGMKKPKEIGTGGKETPEAGKKPEGAKKGTIFKKKISVKRRKQGPDNGDNSNSQYAALGLRACLMSGVDIPGEVIVLAGEWWIKNQNPDGGWGYYARGLGRGVDTSYGSMTAGAAGGLAILDHAAKRPFKKDPVIQKGMDWINTNFSVTGNPGQKDTSLHHYYYLYALERLGMLTGAEKIGTHDWYAEGAEFLLGAQQPDGSWQRMVDPTCFAILFLKRKTQPIIQTGTK
ncbi:MAG: hypothetical protein A2Z34_07825 [Planctomycetes bacterium RBG_16_59_8]|nr:MAG: hypothetical protein A2Z34_07825 [Planctomycetes bacterium RBG_16_59_8]